MIDFIYSPFSLEDAGTENCSQFTTCISLSLISSRAGKHQLLNIIRSSVVTVGLGVHDIGFHLGIIVSLICSNTGGIYMLPAARFTT
jgi:hypothetical protein